MDERPLLSIVVPVYNEQESLPGFLAALGEGLAGVTEDYEVIFAADPCSDRTVEMLREEHARDPRVKVLVFSRRFRAAGGDLGRAFLFHRPGRHRHRLRPAGPAEPDPRNGSFMAGRKQGGPSAAAFAQGRTALRRLITHLGYKVINRISTVPIPRNTGDFRLLDRRVVDELLRLNEGHAFLRGLTGVVGFRTALLPFDRESASRARRSTTRSSAASASVLPGSSPSPTIS